jgi:amino acid transporter
MENTKKPPRVVGIAGAVLLNLNGMVGAGIFALPALLYFGLGNFAPVAIFLFAIPVAFTAAILGKLSTLFKRSGGSQLYTETALGKYVGFQVGWFHICGNTAGRAANFHVLVSYLASIFPFFGGPVARPVTIVCLIAFMAALSVIGTRRSIGGVWVGTFCKLAPLFLLCILGLGMNGLPSVVELPSFSGLESVALLMAYAYSGYALSVVAAGETRNPQGTFFRAIFFSLFGTAVFYALIQWAYIAIDPSVGKDNVPLASAAQKLMGDWGAMMISVAAVFSIGTNQLSNFIAIPRMLYGMGERQLLPGFFAHVSPRFRTPDFAILTYSTLVAALAISGTFTTLAVLTIAVEQVMVALVITSFIVLWRRNFRGLADTMDLRWLPVVMVAIAMVVWMTRQVPQDALYSTIGVILVGTVLYWISKLKISRELAETA